MQEVEYYFRITGSSNIPEKLEMGSDYIIAIEASCNAKRDSTPRQDGTISTTYELKLYGETRIEKRGKTPVFGKVRGVSPSQEIRRALYVYFQQQGTGDFEEWYKKELEKFKKTILDKLV